MNFITKVKNKSSRTKAFVLFLFLQIAHYTDCFLNKNKVLFESI